MRPERICLYLSLSVACACSKSPTPGPGTPAAPQSQPGTTSRAGGHEHDPAQRVDLGSAKIGAFDVHAYQVVKIVPGNEGDFDLDFAAGTTLPGTVRGWVGVETAQGSRKARFAKETEQRMHGHPEIPAPLPADAKLWIEIEDRGATARGSFAIKP